MREVNKQLFGADVIDKTRTVWGLDEEGEVSGSFRPCGYPGVRCILLPDLSRGISSTRISFGTRQESSRARGSNLSTW